MITCLVGVPGSGKSLDMARMIYRDLHPKRNTYVITNIPLNESAIPIGSRDRYCYVSNLELENANILIQIATDYWSCHYAKNHEDAENRIHLYIDECQILFNARDWQRNKEKGWPLFFSVHRHYGFKVYLITQMLTSIDKQVRGVIEYYIQHRKVGNFGMFGWFLGLLTGNRLFVTVTMWAPVDEKIYSEFFLYKAKYGRLYNTHALFDLNGNISEAVIRYEKDIKKDVVNALVAKTDNANKEVSLLEETNLSDFSGSDA